MHPGPNALALHCQHVYFFLLDSLVERVEGVQV